VLTKDELFAHLVKKDRKDSEYVRRFDGNFCIECIKQKLPPLKVNCHQLTANENQSLSLMHLEQYKLGILSSICHDLELLQYRLSEYEKWKTASTDGE
jgi:hypothetical protein